MALPASGAISFSNVNVELSAVETAVRSLNDTVVRNLFGVASGAISMSNGHGKSSTWKATITTHQKEMNLRTWAIANGWDGAIGAEITIANGIYIWSDNNAVAALTTGLFPGGLTIINNGYIMGRGGNGAKGSGAAYGNNYVHATAGGPALALSQSCTIQNNGYIAGGGGGGAGNVQGGGYAYGGGGGGAGGGQGGGWQQSTSVLTTSGGAIGQSGANGWLATVVFTSASVSTGVVGGGGGRILPGSGGASAAAAGTIAYGGGAGGGGAWTYGAEPPGYPGVGGSANMPGGNGDMAGGKGAGGGGGWGASGGSCRGSVGGAGGKAVALNGFSVTWSALGTIYGAVS